MNRNQVVIGLTSVVLSFCLNFTQADENRTYKAEYERWEGLYRADPSFQICGSWCMNKATEKFKEIVKSDARYDSDKYKYPIIIVNLYTQEWPKIYHIVNMQLLLNSIEYVWQVFNDLLTRAIDILSPMVNKRCQRFTVYRGQGCYHPVTNTFGRFTSTTFNPHVALSFPFNTDCRAFIKIENATGLPSQIFSAYQSEEEVILKSNAVFNVKKKLNDSENQENDVREMIKMEMHKLVPWSQIIPDVFVVLEMKESIEKNKNEHVTELNQPSNLVAEYNIRSEMQAIHRDKRATTETIINEEDAWKKHLRSEYDGNDSEGVPKCIATSASSGTEIIEPLQIMTVNLAVASYTIVIFNLFLA